MITQQFYGLIFITVVNHRPIITGNNDQCVLIQSQLFKSIQNFTYTPVKFQ